MGIIAVVAFQPWDDLVIRVGDLLSSAANGALGFVLALVVALIGWGLAALVRVLMLGLLRVVRFNDAFRGLFGETTRLKEPAAIAAWATYWMLVVTALLLAVDTLGFSLVTQVGERVRDVVPRVVAAGVLLAAGVGAATLMGALTRRTFQGAGMRGGVLRGQVVAAIITGFAVLAAIEQLGFATQFVMTLGLIAVAAMGLALGLAFGLGCRELARDFVVEYLRSLEPQDPNRPR
jgi:hypothetical protein